MTTVPDNYVALPGSERRAGPSATLLGTADGNEQVTVTIVLRRRPDGPPMPDMSSYPTTIPAGRTRMTTEEFAGKYGAAPSDIAKVSDFVTAHGMTVVETHAARRTVIARGTVEQMNAAFGVTLGHYRHEVTRGRREGPRVEEYRGREGPIHIPNELASIITGVFGLDNRRVTKRNAGDPPNTGTLTVPQLARLYQFPTNSAAGQTIAIFSEAGYQRSDIAQYRDCGPRRDDRRVFHDLRRAGVGLCRAADRPPRSRRPGLLGALVELLRREWRRRGHPCRRKCQHELAHRPERRLSGCGGSTPHRLHCLGGYGHAIEDPRHHRACSISRERSMGALHRRHDGRQYQRREF
jgi:hypothetical protein